ncbi:hypothetical protein HQ560_10575, partial [bacterium]|nr:hypothetical protein [bacterium]
MTEKTDKTRAWHQAAIGTAIVAGVFSLAVLTIMVRSHVRTEAVRDSELLRVAKAELNRNPDNRALREEIRDLDRVLRQEHVLRTSFNAQGGALLACGLVAFFLAVRAAMTLRKAPPDPTTSGVGPEPRELARWAVMASGGVVVAAAVLLVLSSGSG